MPASGPQKPRGPAAPPEIVANVQGSSAGAGSGEFHVYKASRRREYERLKGMEEEVKEEKEQEEWERQNEERKKMDDEKTERNRKKRRGKGNKDKKGASKKEVMEKGMQVDEKVKDGDQNGTTANPDEIGVVFLEDD